MAISEQVVSILWSNLQLSQYTFVSFLGGNVLGFCRNENTHGKCLSTLSSLFWFKNWYNFYFRQIWAFCTTFVVEYPCHLNEEAKTDS